MSALRPLVLAASALTMSVSQPADARRGEDEIYHDLIHADVPLWGQGPDMWPQHFTDDDGGFGCTSRVAFGDWKFTDSESEVSWWRLTNYGVFHCAIVERRTDERAELKSAHWSYSFFVRIGSVGSGTSQRELWVLQSGTVPGTNYTLLARAADQATIKTFTVLQRRCPPGAERKGAAMDVWQTRYCAINSRNDLLSLARQMVRLPPLGTLEYVEAAPGED